MLALLQISRWFEICEEIKINDFEVFSLLFVWAHEISFVIAQRIKFHRFLFVFLFCRKIKITKISLSCLLVFSPLHNKEREDFHFVSCWTIIQRPKNYCNIEKWKIQSPRKTFAQAKIWDDGDANLKLKLKIG